MDFLEELEEKVEEDSKLMSVPVVTLRNTVAFDDDSVMTFGKYKGNCVKDVPASYLLWWFDQTPTHCTELLAYIVKNKKVLEEEAEVLSGTYHSGVDNDWDQLDIEY